MIYRVFAVPDNVAADTLADPERIHELLESLDEASNELSLEKSWHGLHFLLTGNVWEGDPPLNFLTGGGDEVGDIDVGYGPARILRAPQASIIHDAVTRLPDNYVDAKLDIGEFEAAQIYPAIWSEPRPALVDEYTHFLNQLKEFIKRAAESQHALLLVV